MGIKLILEIPKNSNPMSELIRHQEIMCDHIVGTASKYESCFKDYPRTMFRWFTEQKQELAAYYDFVNPDDYDIAKEFMLVSKAHTACHVLDVMLRSASQYDSLVGHEAVLSHPHYSELRERVRRMIGQIVDREPTDQEWEATYNRASTLKRVFLDIVRAILRNEKRLVHPLERHVVFPVRERCTITEVIESVSELTAEFVYFESYQLNNPNVLGVY